METFSSDTRLDILVRLENAHKIYTMGNQKVAALGGIDVSFARGSFWAIMGFSGSGKSTMMNIIGCLDRLTSGRYVFQEKDISDHGDDALSDIRLRHLGFIFQSFNLIPQLTVQRNIELPLYYLGWDAAKSAEHARELASMVGLEDRLTHRPAELSGGQMQRVAIARALATNPDLILADEPTGNLDSKTSQQIMELLGKFHAAGKTIIMVTHESHIADYAQNRLYMKDGRIQGIEGN
ncbi:MAG: ABC transporter ATP-binding protein [Desulfobacula sp.]|jgi:putative ABC transport system ATP-binding protein|nr:ABC transporter ATP-binding protein [Desulfobacula sp.]